jgi:hypothetical protein
MPTKALFGSLAIIPKEEVTEEQIQSAIAMALRDLGRMYFLYIGDDNPPPQPPPPPHH